MARKQHKKRIRRRERKNIAFGQAHIKASFNNTIINITDVNGNTIVVDVRRIGRLQGFPEVHALCRPGCGGGGVPAGRRARHPQA